MCFTFIKNKIPELSHNCYLELESIASRAETAHWSGGKWLYLGSIEEQCILCTWCINLEETNHIIKLIEHWSIKRHGSIRKISVVVEAFCIFIVVVITRIYTCDKTANSAHTPTHTHTDVCKTSEIWIPSVGATCQFPGWNCLYL